VYSRVSGNIGWIRETACSLSDAGPSFCQGQPPSAPGTSTAPPSAPGGATSPPPSGPGATSPPAAPPASSPGDDFWSGFPWGDDGASGVDDATTDDYIYSNGDDGAAGGGQLHGGGRRHGPGGRGRHGPAGRRRERRGRLVVRRRLLGLLARRRRRRRRRGAREGAPESPVRLSHKLDWPDAELRRSRRRPAKMID
jgi:hypothetical protein